MSSFQKALDDVFGAVTQQRQATHVDDGYPNIQNKMRTQAVAECILLFLTRFHDSPERQQWRIQTILQWPQGGQPGMIFALRKLVEMRPHEADLPGVQTALNIWEDAEVSGEWLADFIDGWPAEKPWPFQATVVGAFWIYRVLSDLHLLEQPHSSRLIGFFEQQLKLRDATDVDRPALFGGMVWVMVHWADHPSWMTDQGHHNFMCIVLGTEGYRRYLGLEEAPPKRAESG
jgi:hypothetical protein